MLGALKTGPAEAAENALGDTLPCFRLILSLRGTNVKGWSDSVGDSVELDSSDPAEIKRAVQELLEGQNRTEVAESVGVSRQQLYRFIDGEAEPSLAEMERLAEFAGEELVITLNRKGPPLREEVYRLRDALKLLVDLMDRLHGEDSKIRAIVDQIRHEHLDGQ